MSGRYKLLWTRFSTIYRLFQTLLDSSEWELWLAPFDSEVTILRSGTTEQEKNQWLPHVRHTSPVPLSGFDFGLASRAAAALHSPALLSDYGSRHGYPTLSPGRHLMSGLQVQSKVADKWATSVHCYWSVFVGGQLLVGNWTISRCTLPFSGFYCEYSLTSRTTSPSGGTVTNLLL